MEHLHQDALCSVTVSGLVASGVFAAPAWGGNQADRSLVSCRGTRSL